MYLYRRKGVAAGLKTERITEVMVLDRGLRREWRYLAVVVVGRSVLAQERCLFLMD